MQQTGVYVDAANIILAAQNNDFPLDVFRLIRHLRDSYRTDYIVYFTGDFRSMRTFFSELQDTGVEMVYKEIYNENERSKANCDVEIAHRITSDILLNKVTRIVLLSGDGDFAHILDFAKSKNKAVKVVAFDPKSCSRMIKRRQFTKVSYLIELSNLIKKTD